MREERARMGAARLPARRPRTTWRSRPSNMTTCSSSPDASVASCTSCFPRSQTSAPNAAVCCCTSMDPKAPCFESAFLVSSLWGVKDLQNLFGSYFYRRNKMNGFDGQMISSSIFVFGRSLLGHNLLRPSPSCLIFLDVWTFLFFG